MSRVAGPQLRVGLMLDSLTVPAWISKIIRQLKDAEFVDLALIVLNSEPSLSRKRFDRLRAPRRQRLLFNLYRRLDERLFAVEPNAFAAVAMEEELISVPTFAVTPHRPRPFEHRFDADAVERVRGADLDILLCFGFPIIRGEILDCARFGVWSYHHGDNREYRGSPDFFWEMYERNPVTGTMLQVLTDDLDPGHVLYRSFSSTDQASLHRGRNSAYWKSAEFVLRCVTALHHQGWHYLQSSPAHLERLSYTKPIYRTPTNRQMLVFFGRLARGILARQARKLAFQDIWYVAYRRCADPRAQLPASTALRDPHGLRAFQRIASPRGRYYADPFVVEDQGRFHLFFEDYDLTTGRGVISTTSIDGRGVPGTPTLALECEYHLSYPFVFRFDGEWYMIPESRERQAIELFRATEFPHSWTFERVLLADVDAVDATLLEHDGRFWLFVNIAVPGASIEDELHLYHSDSLVGDWTAHPRNPIVSDVRCARPAGRIMCDAGELIRPSQDCSRRYGWAVVFNRINRLTPSEYEESPIARLEPGWRRGNLATHTFNRAGDCEVVDAERRVTRFA